MSHHFQAIAGINRQWQHISGDWNPHDPAKFRLSNGTVVSNPLATRMRFVYPTRGDGQVMAPAVKTLGLKIGKIIALGGSRQAEIAANVFNILNAGDYTQYNYSGASEVFNPNYLQMRNQQPARALQMTVVYRF